MSDDYDDNAGVVSTVWKNEKFSLTEEKFRQINCLVISLVKPLLSRNFCEKSVRENFCNFHTVFPNIRLVTINYFHEIFSKIV